MHRRSFVGVAVGGFLLRSFAAHAQQPNRLPRIGFLAFSSPDLTAVQRDAFLVGLRDLGYVDRRNVAIEYRWAEGNKERLPALAGELVTLGVDVILASNSVAALAAKNATSTIPIVFATAGDPAVLVASMARPGGNVTGLSLVAPDIVAKQLELLKAAVPGASYVAVLSNPANPVTASMVKEVNAAARSKGIRIQLLEVRDVAAFDSAYASMVKEHPKALLVLFDPLLLNYRTRITEFATRNQLPAMYPHREYVQSGGLMSYGASIPDMFQHSAAYVVKILNGSKPANLPVEQPTKFELVIGEKAAAALGLTLPLSLTMQAEMI